MKTAEEAVDASTIKKFVHRVFRKTDDIGTLSVKSIREEFLKHRRIESLEAEEKELFKKVVHDVYTLYVNKHKEPNGNQESEDEESQTSESDDKTESFSSSSPTKKKRKIESDSESDNETTGNDSYRDCRGNNNNYLDSSKQQKNKNDSLKPEQTKIEPGNCSYDEQESKKATKTKRTSQDVKNYAITNEKQQEKKKSGMDKTKEEIGSKQNSHGNSSDDERQQTDGNIPAIRAEDKSGDSSSSEVLNEDEMDEQVITKQKKMKSKTIANTNTGKKKSSLPSEDSAKLRNLKRYARSCGMHFKYVDIFADCKSMAHKERILDKLIRDRTGFEGRITLKMCQKYKKKKEEADEVAELDCRNIITADCGGGRTTRSTTQPAPPSVVSKVEGANVFGQLRGIVDSNDSDESGHEKMTGKQALNSPVDKGDYQENRKKRPRLDSSSDDDSDD
ncbi:uncharacterized G-patch domain protein DDB_G0278987-like isoform X2 [Montipora foliosa]|uniref:uncharacterized G-patch domain protein DDB_G0278987-like isoform X2 n=1 Tax=Montipora foliosa TaxID=591990 RepID=UPI0035F1D360